MTFSGQSDSSFDGAGGGTDIEVRKNGAASFFITDTNSADKKAINNISYVWFMKLEEGDKLELYSNYLYVHSMWPLTFTGELVSK